MTHYFNTYKKIVRTKDDYVYETYSYETFDDSTMLQINLQLVGAKENNAWLMAKDMPEDVQWEIIMQFFLTEGMAEALEANGYHIIDKLPDGLSKRIQDEYSNGKYDEYRDKINEQCGKYAYKNCDKCPLFAACNADINEADSKLKTAKWERGMAEAYEKVINQ